MLQCAEILINLYPKHHPNVGRNTIHGASGVCTFVYVYMYITIHGIYIYI